MNRTRNRAGISLLEVLISTFVLAIGILSLAVLIPVGRLSIQQSIISDRAGTCGRAALRDIKTRGMLDPTQWYMPVVNPDVSVVPVPAALALSSFAIDPLFIAEHAVANDPDNAFIQHFPYLRSGNTVGGLLSMRRVTWRGVLERQLLPGDIPIWVPNWALADRCFTWHDDLAFALPESADQRPNAMLDGGMHQINGNYSWLVTVTPAASEDTLPAMARRLCSVSVVVFYKRDLTVARLDPNTGPGEPGLQDPVDLLQNPRPSERRVTANILGGGLSGGSVKLSVRRSDDHDPSITTEQLGEYLDVKKGQWLMLCGSTVVPYTPQPTIPVWRGVFQWYRVVSVGEVFPEWYPSSAPDPPDRMCRMVTLAGPDWDLSWCAKQIVSTTGSFVRFFDLDGDNVFQDAEAVLMDGVVDVYSTTVELDRSLTWGQ